MWEFVLIHGDERLIFQILKLRCTCHNGVLTNVNVSAPLSVHTIRTKQPGLCEKIVQSQNYLGFHPEFSYFSTQE